VITRGRGTSFDPEVVDACTRLFSGSNPSLAPV